LRLKGPDRNEQFENVVMPHVGAAYNLARWLTHNDHDAEDVVQESMLRALRFLDGYRGSDGRSWLLRIVRNTCFTWIQKNRPNEVALPYDEALSDIAAEGADPAKLVLGRIDAALLRQAISELPREFREVIVLREMEALSYREISEIIEIPIGTVMSRLARARKKLHEALVSNLREAD